MAINFFSTPQKEQIVESIRQAETNTSGEIKVHVETKCPGDVMEHAKEVFVSLKLNETKLRNGVLFYIAIDDHKFAILGDAGINAVVPDNFWAAIKDHMRQQFKKGLITEGLCDGITLAGQQLKAHFPYHKDDTNELSDDISFGKHE